jgi:hypothetical protein
VSVSVTLQRASASGAPVTVARGSAITAGDGSWSASLGTGAVGDDRDVIQVSYSGAGAPSPEQILTGNGGNPFTASGWTGWVAMDNGSLVTNSQVVQGFAPPTITLEPCFQTGVEAYSVGGVPGAESPTDFCNTASDAATAPLRAPVTRGQAVAWSSLDDRAFTPPSDPSPNLDGALVQLTVPAGEADSVPSSANPFVAIPQGGPPACTGDLQAATVTCTGLVPGLAYRVRDGATSASARAGATGAVSVPLPVKGGNTVTLSNGSRTLTTLRVAHLRVAVKGNQTVLSGGQCQPGEYYGPPVTTPPTSASAGSITGANVFGAFTARARAGFPGPNNTIIPNHARIALQITRSGHTVFSAPNVDTAGGVRVSGLARGTYSATWTLADANGDTRTVVTQFIEER